MFILININLKFEKHMLTSKLLENDPLIISNRQFSSRLMLGTGKYKNYQEAKESILLSGCQILTVAI